MSWTQARIAALLEMHDFAYAIDDAVARGHMRRIERAVRYLMSR